MNEEEIRELMKEKFDEIDTNDFHALKNAREYSFFLDNGNAIFFKPKQVWPIVFADNFVTVEVDENGAIRLDNQHQDMLFIRSLSVLYEAVEESKRIRGMK
jgi:hypothetical protein